MHSQLPRHVRLSRGKTDSLISDWNRTAAIFLHQLSGNVTTFLVSQRAASIRQADLILVLNDGELAGKGVHEDLIHSCEIYREIYFSQFPEERALYDSSKTAVSGNAAEVTLA